MFCQGLFQLPSGEELFSHLPLNSQDRFLPQPLQQVRAKIIEAERVPELQSAPSFSHKVATARKIVILGQFRPKEPVCEKLDDSVAFAHFSETAAPGVFRALGTGRRDCAAYHQRVGDLDPAVKLPDESGRLRGFEAGLAKGIV
jgi:hypothetical protein